ncbi:MAG: mechanosensitive ion channel family protein [Candidatus ainarchaeum sp.]|nr:mechanosensitive ion channel family protein [Candidatus ainarchaeum sp.]MDD3976268.1 mechanosensitive ion channel family protein [Candidatus ainarchaeum sp.]
MFLEYIFLGNTIKAYLIFIIFIFLGFIISKIFVFLTLNIFKKISKITKNKLDDIIINILSKPMPFKIIIIIIFFNIGFKYLNVLTWISEFIRIGSFLLYVLGFSLFLIKFLLGLIKEYFEKIARKTDSKLDDQLIPLLKGLSKVIVFTISVLIVLKYFGYNISALLAGLGIGGLAIAFAAKDILENFLSGIIIFTEKPFQIDDIIKTSDGFGTIEEVGIRSSKIRTFDGTLINLPNSHLTTKAVENISKRPTRKEVVKLGLTYDTSVSKLEKAKKIITNILTKEKRISEIFYVTFESFGEFSLNISVIYYISFVDYAIYLETIDSVNMQIKKEFEKAKIDFAYPTQTIELKK